ncbi:MAG: CDP-alcohol phosphatidyltransferase family protein [Candidatus Methylacidiphilales bacterium]|nr:CDP-alcohol phosphatidyltransferase family protein [Candidatus Methylacidiphilales bacterium]
MTLPNFITLFRFCLVPVFVGALLYYQRSYRLGEPDSLYWAIALGSFVTASLSDALDGILARRLNLHSQLGAIMDPLADKALLVSAIITLCWLDTDLAQLPIWFAVLVLGRDFLLVAGVIGLQVYVRNIKIKPHWSGKLSTALIMLIVSLILLKCPSAWVDPLVWIGGAFTLLSTGIYLSRGMRAVVTSGIDPPRHR